MLPHVPQFEVLSAKSVHAPEQQPGRIPRHGIARHAPQWFGSEARSEQAPPQHAGLAPVHYSITAYKYKTKYQYRALDLQRGYKLRNC